MPDNQSAINESADVLRYDGAPKRREMIRQLVSERGFCSAKELSDLLGVSEMTIRRDVQELAAAGRLRSVRGGASALPGSGALDIRVRSADHADEKHVIGALAARLLQAGQTVLFDAGTSAYEVARAIAPGLTLTAITHSLPVLGLLSARPNVDLVSLGGVFERRLGMFAPTADGIGSYRGDLLYLGASAIRDGAMYCWTARDGEIKRELMRIADRVVLVCDSSKFVSSKYATFRVGSMADVDVVVTDPGLPGEAREEFESHRIEVLIAEP